MCCACGVCVRCGTECAACVSMSVSVSVRCWVRARFTLSAVNERSARVKNAHFAAATTTGAGAGAAVMVLLLCAHKLKFAGNG